MSTAPTGSIQERDLLVVEGSSIESEGIHLAEFSQSEPWPVDSWRYNRVKRAFDLSCASILSLLFLLPGLMIAAAILLTSRGPIFFREERIGRNGRPFLIWKFRSMQQHAHKSNRISTTGHSGNLLEWRMHKGLRDPRITAVGGFLRRWSLDELPQLINVLSGEMSLIGPRPIVEAETKFYGDQFSRYLAVTPGMSGLWQVSGRSGVDYDKRVMLDAFYVESWSLKFDFSILFRTLPAVLSRSGAA